MKEEYAIYIKPLYENWSVEEAKENIRKAQEENEDILEEITKRIIEAETENNKLKQDNQELKRIVEAYKDKYSDLETDYAKSVENEKTLRYTVNKYYDENKAHKQKEDKLRELLKNNTLKNIKCDCNCLRNFVGNIEQILNDKVVE